MTITEPTSTADERVQQLEAEVAELKALVRDLAQHRSQRADAATIRSTVGEEPVEAATSRRRMLRLAGSAAVGAVAAAVAAPALAAADDGLDILSGTPESTASLTRTTYTGSNTSNSAFVFTDDAFVTNFSANPATLAGFASSSASQPNGVYGFAGQNNGNGVVGRHGGVSAGSGAGVLAISVNGAAIRAEGATAGAILTSSGTGSAAVQATGGLTGVSGVGNLTAGSNGTGVIGLGETGVSGWGGTDGNGYGLAALFSGRASLFLRTTNSLFGTLLKSPPPTRTNQHLAGEIETDSNGDVWYCAADGTPGTWRKLAGPATAGAFHPVTPFRVYDSRAAAPAPGTITGGANRSLSVADARNIDTGAVVTANAVPAGATAIACNLTIVNTVGGGFLTVNPGGTTAVTAASINWSTNGQVLNNGIIAAINPTTRQVTVVAGGGGTCDFVLDVTGYYL